MLNVSNNLKNVFHACFRACTGKLGVADEFYQQTQKGTENFLV